MSPNVPWLFDVMGQTIGFDQSPNPTLVSAAPFEKRVLILVAVSYRSKCHIASVVYVLRMLRIGEPHDNRQDLIAAFLCPRADDVQSVDVARVD